MQVRYIQYVGKKAYKRDRLYGSGVEWNGYGDIQPVPGDAAPKLLQHPDELVEVDEGTFNTFREESDDHGIDTAALERARQRVAAGGSAVTTGSGEDGGSKADGLADAGTGDDGQQTVDSESQQTPEPTGEDDGREPAANPETESRPPQKPEKPVSQLGKGRLIEYAEREFGETIDDSQDAEGVRNRVRELMAEHGLK